MWLFFYIYFLLFNNEINVTLFLQSHSPVLSRPVLTISIIIIIISDIIILYMPLSYLVRLTYYYVV